MLGPAIMLDDALCIITLTGLRSFLLELKRKDVVMLPLEEDFVPFPPVSSHQPISVSTLSTNPAGSTAKLSTSLST